LEGKTRPTCAPASIITIVTLRRQLIDVLSREPRSVSWLARELGMTRGDVEEELRHALRSARAAGYRIDVLPARCRSCDFVFGEDKLTKPGKCPSCKGTRLFEPMVRTSVP
jgi:predicted Zn-ribbon and HTH transcriptional regulator